MKRFFVLDFYRTLSAIIVVFGHANFLQASFVVNFFFILSGFILAFKYEDNFNYKNYVIDRISRMVPLYYLSLLIIFASIFMQDNVFIAKKDILLNLSLLMTLFSSFHLNPPSWSISTELWFNILLFFYLLLPLKRLSKISKIFIIPFLLVIGLFIFRYKSSNLYTFPIQLRMCIFGLFVGFLTFKISKFRFIKGFFQKNTKIIYFLQIIFLNFFIILAIKQINSMIIFYSLTALFLLIFSQKETKITNFFGNKFLKNVGNLSYPIYIFHIPIFIFLNRIKFIKACSVLEILADNNKCTSFLLHNRFELLSYILIVLVFSLFIAKFVEKILNKRVKNFLLKITNNN